MNAIEKIDQIFEALLAEIAVHMPVCNDRILALIHLAKGRECIVKTLHKYQGYNNERKLKERTTRPDQRGGRWKKKPKN